MPARYVVTGQKVASSKKDLARKLRRDMTPAERMLWQEVRNHRLKGLQFRRQQVIGGYIADFYCHATGRVIELDGPIHEQQTEYDAKRDKAIAIYGLRVLRVTNDQVLNNLPCVMMQIAEAARQTDGGTQ
jgi:very-short-patch-repair endonuclease